MEGGEKGGERPILCTATYVQRGARGIPRPLPELRCRAVLLRLSSGGPVCTEEGEPVTSLAVARSPCWRQGGHSLLFTGGGGYNIQLDRLQHTIFKPQPVEIRIYKRYTEERTEIQKEKPRAPALWLRPPPGCPRPSRPRVAAAARALSERLRGCGGSASDSALRRSSSTPTNTKLRCTTANSVSAVRFSRVPVPLGAPGVVVYTLYLHT